MTVPRRQVPPRSDLQEARRAAADSLRVVFLGRGAAPAARDAPPKVGSETICKPSLDCPTLVEPVVMPLGLVSFAETLAKIVPLWKLMKSTARPLRLVPTMSESPLPRPLGCVVEVILTPPKPPAPRLKLRYTDCVPTVSEQVWLAPSPEPYLCRARCVIAEPSLCSVSPGCALVSSVHAFGRVAADTSHAAAKPASTTPITTPIPDQGMRFAHRQPMPLEVIEVAYEDFAMSRAPSP